MAHPAFTPQPLFTNPFEQPRSPLNSLRFFPLPALGGRVDTVPVQWCGAQKGRKWAVLPTSVPKGQQRKVPGGSTKTSRMDSSSPLCSIELIEEVRFKSKIGGAPQIEVDLMAILMCAHDLGPAPALCLKAHATDAAGNSCNANALLPGPLFYLKILSVQ